MASRLTVCALVSVCLVFAAGATLAQDNGIAQGKKNVAFAVPGGGGALVGGKYFLSASSALGLDVGYSVTIPEHGDSTGGFTLLPSYTWYLTTQGRLLTFLKGALNITKIQGVDFSDALTLDIGGFFGVEFFVTKEFSLAGELGLAINFRNDFETVTSQAGTGSLFAQFFF